MILDSFDRFRKSISFFFFFFLIDATRQKKKKKQYQRREIVNLGDIWILIFNPV